MNARRTRVKFASVVAFGVMSADWQLASGCSCTSPADAQSSAQSVDAVFRGVVVDIREERVACADRPDDDCNVRMEQPNGSQISIRQQRRVSFRVLCAWKGVEAPTLEVISSSVGCGYPFTVGEEYLVYALRRGQQFEVDNCHRTYPFGYSSKGYPAQAEIDALSLGRPPYAVGEGK